MIRRMHSQYVRIDVGHLTSTYLVPVTIKCTDGFPMICIVYSIISQTYYTFIY